MAESLVVCVVVNWNGWRDTLECLASLKSQTYGQLQVIVVDNGSANDSVARIREAHPWVTLIETGSNLGFGRACNVGAALALERGADYIWLLNNDTVAPADTTSKLVNAAAENPRAGAIGTVLHYMQEPDRVQAWGGGTIDLWSGYVRHLVAPARFGPRSFLTGASLLLPRKVCITVGLFDEAYFMYSEDADLCLRIREAGYELVVAETTAVLHKEGASSPKRSRTTDRYTTASTLRLLRRHAPAPIFAGGLFLFLRISNRIARGEWSNLIGVCQGVRASLRRRGPITSMAESR